MIEEMQHVAVELLAILKKREVADLGLKQRPAPGMFKARISFLCCM